MHVREACHYRSIECETSLVLAFRIGDGLGHTCGWLNADRLLWFIRLTERQCCASENMAWAPISQCPCTNMNAHPDDTPPFDVPIRGLT